jgi:taurine---2-oxoglutarate transaminase
MQMTSQVGPQTTDSALLSADEIVSLSREYSLYEWVAQGSAAPLPVATAKGSYFYTADGRRFLDFNSQSMSVNIGHGDQRVIDAIAAQAQRLTFVSPFLAHEPRARLGRKLAELLPGDLDVTFFTNGGADANENAIKLARQVTGRHKVLARYRSYHGATGVAIAATGDPRRWAAEAGVSGIVRAPDFHKWGRPEPEPVERALQELEDVVMYEGGHTIAAFILEPVVGANGVLIPPDGYLQGVRAICDRHGILLIADEVMSGFGRTGRWFAVEHWGVVPDLLTMAKGLTSSYVPLGGVAMRRPIAEAFRDRPYVGGLTYNSHPLGCAAALAVIDVMEQDGLVERSARLGEVMRGHHERLAERHPSVGAHRNLGLFGVLDLVRDRSTHEPLAPFDGTSDEMQAIHRHFRERGLYAFLRYHMIHTTPPLSVSEEELAEGFEIIDTALEIADRGMRG